MDKSNYSMEHRKGQHLLAEERHEIEIRLKDGWSIYQIAHQLKRSYNKIKNEVRRGRVLLYGGKVSRYKAKVGEARYRENRAASRKQYKRLAVDRFCNYVEQHFTEDPWSLDVCYGQALASGAFERCSCCLSSILSSTSPSVVDLSLSLCCRLCRSADCADWR